MGEFESLIGIAKGSSWCDSAAGRQAVRWGCPAVHKLGWTPPATSPSQLRPVPFSSLSWELHCRLLSVIAHQL